MEILEMIFGYFLIWLIGAISILLGIGGGLVIRYHYSKNDPHVIYSVLFGEIVWLIAVLIFIVYPEFYEGLSSSLT